MIIRMLPALTALTLAASADAQIFLTPSDVRRNVTFDVDVGPQFARPVGEFRANVRRAWGGGVALRLGVREFPLGLRTDFAYLNYGNERKTVQMSPTINRVMVDLNTTNNIFLATAGPELAVRRGPIQPYAYAFAGLGYLFTESSVGDDDGDGSGIASTTNFDDGGWATGWGAGFRIPLRLRNTYAAIDASARLTRNGTRSYLTRGDITDRPDGTLQFNERRTAVDFWQYQLGMTFGTGRRRR